MTSIKSKLDKLTNEDTYSLLLFALYKLKDIPEYSTLSELAYILDIDSLLNLLELFGGITITVPEVRDLKLVSYCLLLYKQVELDGVDFTKAVRNMNITSEYSIKEIRELYTVLKDVLSNYSFNRGRN